MAQVTLVSRVSSSLILVFSHDLLTLNVRLMKRNMFAMSTLHSRRGCAHCRRSFMYFRQLPDYLRLEAELMENHWFVVDQRDSYPRVGIPTRL